MRLSFRIGAIGALLGAMLLGGCGTGGGRIESGLTRTAPPGAAEQACSRDAECALVDDCCGCENGGTRQAVRSDAIASLAETAETTCEGRVCTDGISSQHRSCTASAAVCRGGRCIPAL